MGWLEEYLYCDAEPKSDLSTYGIASEYVCWLALDAVHLQDPTRFFQAVDSIEFGPIVEVLLGDAGLLVLLRFVKRFIAGHEDAINTRIKTVADHIDETPWLFHGREYTGAAHGNVGIITQLCLSGYSKLAGQRLNPCLDLQQENGSWLSTTDRKHEHMQWCHGTAGCVISLLAVQGYFPEHKARIELAIARGQALIFEKGILKKEPCLCHGATGNALALEEKQRVHLLSFTTPDAVSAGEWDISADAYGLFCGEAGRAWVWAMLDGGCRGFPAYIDV